MAATPLKSTVPVSTIGGEPGGRAPIVVQDNVAVPSEHTTVDLAKAEPGRDIFAGEPPKDIKSDAPNPALPHEEKEVSLVITQQSTSALASSETQKEKAEESASTDSSAASHSDEASIQDESSTDTQHHNVETTVTQTTAKGEDQENHKLAGPLVEAEAEADRAAHELYPDAHIEK